MMMLGINHQNIFEEHEDYYQFLNTLDMMALSYEPDGTPLRRNYILDSDFQDASLQRLPKGDAASAALFHEISAVKNQTAAASM